MSMSPKSLFKLPGFRFHPTEHELVSFYLENKVQGTLNIPPSLIQDVNFYQHDPWSLYDSLSSSQQQYLYVFVPRDRKYPNGSRPNRVACSGYWKATGTDKKVVSSNGECIGLKKTLVFYRGKAPNGERTEWIMNEFRLPRTDSANHSVAKEFDVTLCRLYRKHSGNSSSVSPSPSAAQFESKPAVCDASVSEKAPVMSSGSEVENVSLDSLEEMKFWLEDPETEVQSSFRDYISFGSLVTPNSSRLESRLRSQELFCSSTENPWLAGASDV